MPAGRPAGAPNKAKRALIALLDETFPGYHPVIEMARIANDKDVDLPMRASMHKEVAKYVTPQLKAVEVDTINHQPVQVQIVRYSDTDTVKPRES